MQLVALDLEGSGAQDHDQEAILEIALIPLHDRQPDIGDAYSTLINPGRPIPQRPWISAGLTDDVLATAPLLADVQPRLARLINGKHLVGHNIGVDWRLLHRRCPDLTPAGLIDTLRLARTLDRTSRNNLTALVQRFDLNDDVNHLAAESAPHRALWDTAAAALLLTTLITRALGPQCTDEDLLKAAGLPLGEPKTDPHPTLFD